MKILKGEMQTEQSDVILHPHTSIDVVFNDNGIPLSDILKNLEQGLPPSTTPPDNNGNNNNPGDFILKTQIKNNLKETTTGNVLDARQGKVLNDKIEDLEDQLINNLYTHPATHDASMITGLPTSLPANGGNSDTVDGKHADDFILKTNINNTLTETTKGNILDATQGKILNDKIEDLSILVNKQISKFDNICLGVDGIKTGLQASIDEGFTDSSAYRYMDSYLGKTTNVFLHNAIDSPNLETKGWLSNIWHSGKGFSSSADTTEDEEVNFMTWTCYVNKEVWTRIVTRLSTDLSITKDTGWELSTVPNRKLLTIYPYTGIIITENKSFIENGKVAYINFQARRVDGLPFTQNTYNQILSNTGLTQHIEARTILTSQTFTQVTADGYLRQPIGVSICNIFSNSLFLYPEIDNALAVLIVGYVMLE